jgi:hypothetical protein
VIAVVGMLALAACASSKTKTSTGLAGKTMRFGAVF